jgi:hypothetical protein
LAITFIERRESGEGRSHLFGGRGERRGRDDTGDCSTRLRFSASRFFAAANTLTLLERVETGIQGVLPQLTSDHALNFTGITPYIFFKICGNSPIHNTIIINPMMEIFHLGM